MSRTSGLLRRITIDVAERADVEWSAVSIAFVFNADSERWGWRVTINPWPGGPMAFGTGTRLSEAIKRALAHVEPRAVRES